MKFILTSRPGTQLHEIAEALRTTHNWVVMTLNEAFRNDPTTADAIIIDDPTAIPTICKEWPDYTFSIVYIVAEDNDMRQHLLDQMAAQMHDDERNTFLARIRALDAEFATFDETIQQETLKINGINSIATRIIKDYSQGEIARHAKNLDMHKRLIDRIGQIIETFVANGQIETSNGKLIISMQDENGDVHPRTSDIESLAEYLATGDPAYFADFVKVWLSGNNVALV